MKFVETNKNHGIDGHILSDLNFELCKSFTQITSGSGIYKFDKKSCVKVANLMPKNLN